MKPKCFLYLCFLTVVIFMGLVCERPEVQQKDTVQYGVASFEEPNVLTEPAKEEGWKLLFDGEATEGPILLQDHGSRVAFRNIRIKEL